MGKPLKPVRNVIISRNRSTDFFVHYISGSGMDLPAAREIFAQMQCRETPFDILVEKHRVDAVSEDELLAPKGKKVRALRVQRSRGAP